MGNSIVRQELAIAGRRAFTPQPSDDIELF
jgi:hypothetical protein